MGLFMCLYCSNRKTDFWFMSFLFRVIFPFRNRKIVKWYFYVDKKERIEIGEKKNFLKEEEILIEK